MDKVDNETKLSTNCVASIVNGCQAALSDGKYRSVREKASNVINILAKKGYKLPTNVLLNLEKVAEAERDAAIQDNLKKSIHMFQ